MSTTPSLLLNYRFDSGRVTSGGTHPLEGVPGPLVAGPPTPTLLGAYPAAMQFGRGAHLWTQLAAGEVPDRAFCVRMLIQPTAGATRELLCRCDTVPFALWLTPGVTPAQRGVQGIVDAQAHGWQGIQTLRSGIGLTAGTWHTVDLVFAYDALGVFVDGRMALAYGFADGRLRTAPGGRLVVGGEPADEATRFTGRLAALQVYAGAPAPLERALDAARGSEHWHITREFTRVNGRELLGRAVGELEWDGLARAHVIRFEKGVVHYTPTLGAHVLSGELYRGYLALHAGERAALGPLTTGVVEMQNPPRRYARFEGGGLFHSRATGFVPVTGVIYQRYMQAGGPSGPAGLPRQRAWRVGGGREQLFQRARYVEQDATGQGFELRGGILRKYVAMGGISACGFPLSEETPLREEGRHVGGRCDFQRCTLFFVEPGSAFAVPGDFVRATGAGGGAAGVVGELGLPTSDVVTVGTGSLAVQYQTFQRGTVVRLPGHSAPFVCPAFQIFIKRLDTDESEGIGQGKNDPYFFLDVYQSRMGGEEESLYARRVPDSGDFENLNIVELDRTLPLTLETRDATVTYRLRADVWEGDSALGFGDDHLGDVSYELSVFNAWGQAANDGVLTAIDRKAKLLFSVKPAFNRDNYSFTQWHFFPFANRSTQNISWNSYATAFAGHVDTDISPDDILFDPLGTIWATIFYNIFGKRLARGGNCWGFAVEAMQAWNGTSLFSPPLSRFSWEQAEKEINVKMVAQLGTDRLLWQTEQFVLGRTQDPVGLFRRSRDEARQNGPGALPVLTTIEKAAPFFDGEVHAVLPFQWDDSKIPWVIHTYDSKHPGRISQIEVWPGEDRWRMVSGTKTYEGTRGAGSRIYHTPWCIAGRIPAPLPFLEAWLLWAIRLVAHIVWDGFESEVFVDGERQNLDITRATPQDALRRRFMMVPMADPAPGDGAEMWVRRTNTGSLTYSQELRLRSSATAAKPWRYAVAQAHGDLYLTGRGAAGDRVRLGFDSLGKRYGRCTVSGSAGATFTAAYIARTDEAGGQVKMILEGLPMGATPVQLSFKPNLEGFEVIAPGGGVATLTLTSARDGVGVSRRYRLPLAGARVRISTALENGELLVYGIQALDGIPRGTTVLQPVA